jgi:hypothetical protein
LRRLFSIPDKKPPLAEYPITFDLAAYLGTEELSGTLSLAATNLTSGLNAGTSILNVSKSTMGTSQVKPWIQGGTPGHTYKVMIKIQTNATNTPIDRFGFLIEVDNI